MTADFSLCDTTSGFFTEIGGHEGEAVEIVDDWAPDEDDEYNFGAANK